MAADYLESTIGRFYPKTRQLSKEPDFLMDRVLRLDTDSVLVVFSVWPCTKATIDAADVANQRGIPVILITNTMLNPIARYAQVVIDTNSVNSSCGNMATMFVTEALIAEMGRQTAPESTHTLETLESQLGRAGRIHTGARPVKAVTSFLFERYLRSETPSPRLVRAYLSKRIFYVQRNGKRTDCGRLRPAHPHHPVRLPAGAQRPGAGPRGGRPWEWPA